MPGAQQVRHLRCPGAGLPELFMARALPFGAFTSVHGFNRAAMPLNHLLHESVGQPCAHYFDDFTIIFPEGISEAADQMAGGFLE